MKSRKIKLVLAAASAVAFSQTSLGAYVSPERAAENAVAELQSGLSPVGMRAKGTKAPTADRLQLAYTSASPAGTCFYVYNVKAQPGFVIAPADDRLPAVLAYSETGSFDTSAMPENVKWWLSQYEGEINLILSGKAMARRDVPGRAARKPVAPLVTTKWNQSAPYNNDCPTDAGGRCVTGCVATAMAQVMKYHNWPPQGKGANGSYSFEGHKYDWTNMLDVYAEGKYDSTQAAAVAQLMVDCGRGVNMNYTSSASGAQSNMVGVALTDYFDYDPSLRLHVRLGYPLGEWEQTVYEEMAAGRPVYYSGTNESAGHAFVCDGYQGDGFFHFNWGWGGAYDGYFRLFALDPAGGGIGSSDGGYNLGQQIFTNVIPNTGKPCPKQVLLVPGGGYSGHIENNEVILEFYDYDTKELSGIFNYLGYTEKVEIASKWTDMADESKVYYTDAQEVEIQTYYGIRGVNDGIPASAGNGKYKMQVVYRSPEVPDTWYVIRGLDGQPQYLEVTVADGKITSVESQKVDNSPKAVLLDVESASAEVKAGSSQVFRISLANVGAGTFTAGEYYASDGGYLDNYLTLNFAEAANPEKVVKSVRLKNGFTIPSNYTSNFTTTPMFMPEAGEYLVSLSCTTGVIGSVPMTVVGETETYKPGCLACNFTGMAPAFADATDTEGLSITFLEQNGVFTGQSAQDAYVSVRIYKADTDELILNGNYQARYFTGIVGRASYMPISDLEPGYYYWQVYYVKPTGEEFTMSPKSPLLIYRSATTADGSMNYNIVPTASGLAATLTSVPAADASGAVVIPEEIEGYKTVSINPGLFTFDTTVPSVSIPAGINVSSGQFYCSSSLKDVAVKGASPAYCSPTAFGPDMPAGITLDVPAGTANLYKRAEGWNLFTFGSWRISLGSGYSVAEGLLTDASTGTLYDPYYVGAGETVRFRLDETVGVMVVAKVNDGPDETLTPDAEGFYTLPDLNGGTGRLYISGQNGVDDIEAEGAPVDVYTLTGICVGRSMTAGEIRNLPAGIYIAGKRKIRING